MRLFLLLVFIHLFYVFHVNGQSPAIEWQKTFGGIQGEYAHAMEATSDGGYIISGSTEGPDYGDIMGYHGNSSVGDFLVVKMDANGKVEWQKCLGGFNQETYSFIHQTADGGYIVAGSTASTDCNVKTRSYSLDYWLVKLNAKGDIQWQKTFGGNKHEYAWGLTIAKDGGYIVAGHSESVDGDVTGNHGDRDVWVIKTDPSGNLQWQRSLGGTAEDAALSTDATADGGCIVAGYTESLNGDVTGNRGKRDVWIVKLDNTGKTEWQKNFGGSSNDVAWSVKTVPAGGYIVAGVTSSNDGDVTGNHWASGPFQDFWLLRLDASGGLLWQKCYGGQKNDNGYAVSTAPDGGFVIAGSSESADGDAGCNGGYMDMLVIKTNSSGVLQWSKNLGGVSTEEAFAVQALNDGSVVVAGETCSSNVEGYHAAGSQNTCGDIWVIKLANPQAGMPPPKVAVLPANGIVCGSSPAVFTAAVTYGGMNPQYQWTINGIPAGNNIAVLKATVQANDKIACFVSRSNGCEPNAGSTSSPVTVQIVNPAAQPAITITADNTVLCDCTPVSFLASIVNPDNAPQYQWKINGNATSFTGNTLTGNNFKDGDMISCVYTGNASCVAGGSIESNTITLKKAAVANPTISIATPTATVCPGTPVTITASTQNAGLNPVYQWKVNGVNAGNGSNPLVLASLADHDKITCSIQTDPLFNCTQATNAVSNTIEILISSQANPTVSIAAASPTVCAGTTAAFTATALNAGGNPSYQWKINGLNAGNNSSNFSSSSIQNGDVVSCTITVDPLFTCAVTSNALSNSINMQVVTGANPSVSITASATGACAGTPLQFSAVTTNAGASPVYAWKLNNQAVGSNSPVFSSNAIKNGDAISCEITPGTGACTVASVASNSIRPVVFDLPVISLVPADTIIAAGKQVVLQGVVTGNIVAYSWSPPDKLVNPQSLNVQTTALQQNTAYTLTVETEKGCRASATTQVKIYKPLYMPNAFTPNHDLKNDAFKIPNDVSMVLQEFSVFDRWGQRVFFTRNAKEGWDGNVFGKPAAAGAYIYYVKGTGANNTAIVLKGTVLLIR